MNSGKCNLLLIKTFCWRRLQTDSNLRLASSHFSSPSSIILFSLCCSDNAGSHIFLLLSHHSTLPSNPVPLFLSSTLSTSVYLCHPLFCFFWFIFNYFSCPLSIFFYHSPSTMMRRREPSAGRSSSSTTTSWRRRSPLINSERTM